MGNGYKTIKFRVAKDDTDKQYLINKNPYKPDIILHIFIENQK